MHPTEHAEPARGRDAQLEEATDERNRRGDVVMARMLAEGRDQVSEAEADWIMAPLWAISPHRPRTDGEV